MAYSPGLDTGLSFQVDYNSRINDLHRNEELNRRAQSDAQARAAMFASDVEFQNSMNTHDAPIIKEYARGIVKQMGEYRRNNPDLMYNPDKLIQFNLMKRELKDNPDLIRGLSSDNSYKEYVKDLQEVAKNPQQHDVEAYDNVKNQWSNYLQYGNQNGLEAFQKEGKKAFLYSKPRDFIDLPSAGLKLGDSFNNYNQVYGKNNPGEWWSEPVKEQLDAVKNSFYQQNKRQVDVEARKAGFTTQEQVDKWVGNLIAPGIKKNYHIGDANARWERDYKLQQLALEKEKMENKKPGPTYTPWDHFTDPKNRAGTIPVVIARKIWNDNPKMELIGVDGSKVDLTGHDLNYDGRFVKNKDNIPFLLGSVKLPMEVAFDKGIIKDVNAKDVTGISSAYLGQVHIQRGANDKDGNEQRYVTVDYHLPVNVNDITARQRFNGEADVDKLVPASNNPYTTSGKKSAPVGAGVDEKGNVFSSNGQYLGKVEEFQ